MNRRPNNRNPSQPDLAATTVSLKIMLMSSGATRETVGLKTLRLFSLAA